MDKIGAGVLVKARPGGMNWRCTGCRVARRREGARTRPWGVLHSDTDSDTVVLLTRSFGAGIG